MAIKVKDAEKAYRAKNVELPHTNCTEMGVRPTSVGEINHALYDAILSPSDARIAEKEIADMEQEDLDELREASARRKGLR